MKRSLFILSLVLTLHLNATRAANKTTEPDFSEYPQTESFKSYLSFNQQPEHVLSLPQHGSCLLTISAFPQGAGYAIQYVAYADGYERDWRWVYNLAFEAEHEKRLPETILSDLRAATRDLPPEDGSPPVQRLVVVGFYDGAKWTVHKYDSQTLSLAMRRIYDLIGERFESKRP